MEVLEKAVERNCFYPWRLR